ncbi:hypothetical protein G6F55_001726 [Rhizopus delemar]|uniref:Uncharacterized protein n=2 Tax=Rhizopus TaxID=4842 RepID=A0A9P6ZBX6_9FUNG|nr:hypothetical protein G6F55_001726 [Rhizopus delemar]KAG1528482.1 hypothetical protein G6F52_000612 [Rhizopus delemar]KAG1550036.1 hypothetical protein G6F51_002698 [Rhizopus arrhizus]KAG1574659.1 hypothetical protein G6F50_001783 [Rhizopus delemar]KAG1635646.1 hypothetical protein G6F45_001873 [Rhizopus arrhizus]
MSCPHSDEMKAYFQQPTTSLSVKRGAQQLWQSPAVLVLLLLVLVSGVETRSLRESLLSNNTSNNILQRSSRKYHMAERTNGMGLCQASEEGETSINYLKNMYRQRTVEQHITTLRTDDSADPVEDVDQPLSVTHQFYQSLYTADPVDDG